MKKFWILFYTLFLLGFGLKFFHIHYNALFMLLGAGCILISSIIYLFQKEKRIEGLLHFSTGIWLVVLLISLKFFAFGFWAFILAIIISNVLLVVYYRNKMMHRLHLFFVAMVLALVFYFIPTDNRYYILNIKWNYEIESDYYTWDKYSWFLYQNGEYNEAEKASEKALKMARDANDPQMMEFIEMHQQAIKKEK